MKAKDLINANIGIEATCGDLEREVKNPRSILEARDGSFLFCTEKYYDLLRGLQDCVIMVPATFMDFAPDNTYLLVKDDYDYIRLVYARAVNLMFPPRDIRLRSLIVNTVEVLVQPGAIIEEGCELGSNVVVGANAVILKGTKIGNMVDIFPGAVIGVDGFGFHKASSGEWERFPHLAGVTIGDNVEIGANTVINRGALSDTIIGDGSKIDSFNHIAHNVVMGKNTWIASGCVIAGSVVIGDNCEIASGVITRNEIRIGNNVFIGVGSVVTKDLPDGARVMGNPARDIEEAKRMMDFMKKSIK